MIFLIPEIEMDHFFTSKNYTVLLLFHFLFTALNTSMKGYRNFILRNWLGNIYQWRQLATPLISGINKYSTTYGEAK